MWNSFSHEDFVLVEFSVQCIHISSVPIKTTFKCEPWKYKLNSNMTGKIIKLLDELLYIKVNALVKIY